METKFKIGDKVKIKNNLITGKVYDSMAYFTSKMKKYRGKEATVIMVIAVCNGVRYKLDVDNCRWTYSDSMLDRVGIIKDDSRQIPDGFTGTITVKNGIIIETKSMVEKEEILDEVEKKYLSAVIKPFKKKIKYIAIFRCSRSVGNIFIKVDRNNGIALPYFEIGTMYKNMEIDKRYTLEELGLN